MDQSNSMSGSPDGCRTNHETRRRVAGARVRCGAVREDDGSTAAGGGGPSPLAGRPRTQCVALGFLLPLTLLPGSRSLRLLRLP
jgi:hypothetical protein